MGNAQRNPCIKMSNPSQSEVVNDAKRILEKRDFVYIDSLGKGAFGDVMHLHSRNLDTALAAKIIPRHSVTRGEIQYWSRLQHRNVLPLFEMMYLPDMSAFVFTMPVEAATMSQLIRRKKFREDSNCLGFVKSWLRDVLEGLKYIHRQQLAHLDLKSNNILISNELNAIICDFSYMESTKAPIILFGAPGHLRPPEGCHSFGTSLPADGVAIDIWTFGMLALDAVTGHTVRSHLPQRPQYWSRETYVGLFKVLQNDNLEHYIRNGLRGADVDVATIRKIQNFVHTCLQIDPEKRPSAEQVLAHSFLERGEFWSEVDARWTKRVAPMEIEIMINRFQQRQRRLQNATKMKVLDNYDGPVILINSDGTRRRGSIEFNPMTKYLDIVQDDDENQDVSNLSTEDQSDTDLRPDCEYVTVSTETIGTDNTLIRNQEDEDPIAENTDVSTSHKRNPVNIPMENEVDEDELHENFNASQHPERIEIPVQSVLDETEGIVLKACVNGGPQTSMNPEGNSEDADNHVEVTSKIADSGNVNDDDEYQDVSNLSTEDQSDTDLRQDSEYVTVSTETIGTDNTLIRNQEDADPIAENIDVSTSHERNSVNIPMDNEVDEDELHENFDASQQPERIEISVQSGLDEPEGIVLKACVNGGPQTSMNTEGNNEVADNHVEVTSKIADSSNLNGTSKKREKGRRGFSGWLRKKAQFVRSFFRRRRG